MLLMAAPAPAQAKEALKQTDEVSPGWKELLSLKGPMDFATGLYDGLQMQENAQMHECERLVDDKVQDNLILLYNHTLSYDIFKALDVLADIVYNAYGIYETCPIGFKQGFDSIALVEEKMKDPKHYMDNLIFNFGLIFDNIRDFYMWLQFGSMGEENGPYNNGFALGNVAYYAFFKTDSTRRPK